MEDLNQREQTLPLNNDTSIMGNILKDLPDNNSPHVPVVHVSPLDTNTTSSLKRMVLAYFAGWTIYSQDVQKLAEVDYTKLTHLTYAFAKIDAESGRIQIADAWADLGLNNGETTSKTLNGNLGEFWKIKQQYRHLKTGLAVGGWEDSGEFSGMCASQSKRRAFNGSLLKACIDFGLDYVDLDWEYPVGGGKPENGVSPNDTVNFTTLIKEWDDLATRAVKRGKLGRKPGLTMAIPAAESQLQGFPLEDIAPYVTKFLLMGYDFGAYNERRVADHNANMYQRQGTEAVIVQDDKMEWEAAIQGDWSSQCSLEKSVDYMINKRGIKAEQVVAGVPFYGRILNAANGLATELGEVKKTPPSLGPKAILRSLFRKFGRLQMLHSQKSMADAPFEAKLISYREILKLLLNMHSFWEPSCAAEFAVNTAEPWTAETNTFITYESPRSIALKVDFVKERGLGGLMAWELSLDLQASEELSLLGLINKRLVENTMDKDMGENSLEYSSSRFGNVKNVVNQAAVTGETTPAGLRKKGEEQGKDEELDALLELLPIILGQKVPGEQIVKQEETLGKVEENPIATIKQDSNLPSPKAPAQQVPVVTPQNIKPDSNIPTEINQTNDAPKDTDKESVPKLNDKDTKTEAVDKAPNNNIN